MKHKLEWSLISNSVLQPLFSEKVEVSNMEPKKRCNLAIKSLENHRAVHVVEKWMKEQRVIFLSAYSALFRIFIIVLKINIKNFAESQAPRVQPTLYWV